MEDEDGMDENLEKIIQEAESLAQKVSTIESQLDRLRTRAYQLEEGSPLPEDTDMVEQGVEGLPDVNLQSLDMIARSSEIIESLTSQAQLGRQAEEGMAHIRRVMAELEEKMAQLLSRTESVAQSQMAVEKVMKKNMALERTWERLDNFERAALSLEEKLLRLGKESNTLDDAMERQEAMAMRLDGQMDGAREAMLKMESAREGMEAATIIYKTTREAEERLVKLRGELAEKETRLIDQVSRAEGVAEEFERFYHMKRRAERTLEQVEKRAQRAEEILAANQAVEGRVAATTDRMDEMERRFETLAVKALDITEFEETYNSTHRKLEAALSVMEELEEKIRKADQLENKLRALSESADNLRAQLGSMEKESGSAGKMMETFRNAELRAEELIEKMDAAGDRLDTASGLQRTLSVMEEKVFEIIKKIEVIEDKGKIIHTAQQKIDRLQKLLDQAEVMMKKIVSG